MVLAAAASWCWPLLPHGASCSCPASCCSPPSCRLLRMRARLSRCPGSTRRAALSMKGAQRARGPCSCTATPARSTGAPGAASRCCGRYGASCGSSPLRISVRHLRSSTRSGAAATDLTLKLSCCGTTATHSSTCREGTRVGKAVTSIGGGCHASTGHENAAVPVGGLPVETL
ncbi:hypothetical protein COO60DRAFT_704668 [Scenedesmus sp. NREL 46B-D3]|nr:hypothetical protein COO60DRAFT_704668 [Scenedesmus sp. NREL 46B-D3]